jgi:hypothetical protein
MDEATLVKTNPLQDWDRTRLLNGLVKHLMGQFGFCGTYLNPSTMDEATLVKTNPLQDWDRTRLIRVSDAIFMIK